MWLYNVKNPDISLALVPYFIEAEKPRLDIGLELYERLKNNPNDTFCLIGTEDGVLHGMLIAYVREKDIWVWQTKADSKFRKYSAVGYRLLEEWAKYKKRSEIRGSPSKKRLKRYYCKHYGYRLDGEEIVKSLRGE